MVENFIDKIRVLIGKAIIFVEILLNEVQNCMYFCTEFNFKIFTHEKRH